MGAVRMVGPTTQFLDLETLNTALDLCEDILEDDEYEYEEESNQIHFASTKAEYKFSVAWQSKSW